jgi:hypothetical protein
VHSERDPAYKPLEIGVFSEFGRRYAREIGEIRDRHDLGRLAGYAFMRRSPAPGSAGKADCIVVAGDRRFAQVGFDLLAGKVRVTDLMPVGDSLWAEGLRKSRRIGGEGFRPLLVETAEEFGSLYADEIAKIASVHRLGRPLGYCFGRRSQVPGAPPADGERFDAVHVFGASGIAVVGLSLSKGFATSYTMFPVGPAVGAAA